LTILIWSDIYGRSAHNQRSLEKNREEICRKLEDFVGKTATVLAKQRG